MTSPLSACRCMYFIKVHIFREVKFSSIYTFIRCIEYIVPMHCSILFFRVIWHSTLFRCNGSHSIFGEKFGPRYIYLAPFALLKRCSKLTIEYNYTYIIMLSLVLFFEGIILGFFYCWLRDSCKTVHEYFIQ